MLTTATSKWGLNGEERAELLRVRTGPECPEGNWRELMWDSNLNYGIARERQKITWQKALTGHCCASPFAEQRKGWEFQRRASQQRGGKRGKFGPRDSIPYQTANRLPVSNQRLPEILDGWHPPGGLRLETSSPEPTQGAPNQRPRELRQGPRRGEGAHHTGESTPVMLLAAWAAQAGKA